MTSSNIAPASCSCQFCGSAPIPVITDGAPHFADRKLCGRARDSVVAPDRQERAARGASDTGPPLGRSRR
jgi:hypothetical protein